MQHTKEKIQQNCHIVKIARYGKSYDEWSELHDLLADYVACLSGELIEDTSDQMVVYFPKDINADGMYIQIVEEKQSEFLKEKARILFQTIFREGEILTSWPKTGHI